MIKVELENISKEQLDKLKPALDILNNDLFKGREVFIAGGYLRKLLFNIKIDESDVDIYTSNSKDYIILTEVKAKVEEEVKKELTELEKVTQGTPVYVDNETSTISAAEYSYFTNSPTDHSHFTPEFVARLISGYSVSTSFNPSKTPSLKKESSKKITKFDILGQKCQILSGPLFSKDSYATVDLERVLRNFDFTCCCFGLSRKEFICHEQAFEHSEKKLIYTNCFSEVGFLERLQKYIQKGFTIGSVSDLYYKINNLHGYGKTLKKMAASYGDK